MALNGQFVNLNLILESLDRRYGFSEVHRSDVAEFVWEIAGYVLEPSSFRENYAEIACTDFRGNLPTDFYDITEGAVIVKDTNIPLTYNTDLLNRFDLDGDPDDIDTDFYTYCIKEDYIFCGMEKPTLVMQYKSFPIDTEGMPLVPKNAKAIRAVRDYIAENLAFKYFLQDKLSERKYEIIKQESHFSTASYMSSVKIPSIDQLERMKNRYITLLTRPDHHNSNFKYMGTKTFHPTVYPEGADPYAPTVGEIFLDDDQDLFTDN